MPKKELPILRKRRASRLAITKGESGCKEREITWFLAFFSGG